jgi:4-hydroxy-3-methylbut-2-enyl diphosphate reductase
MKITLASHYGLCFGVRDALHRTTTLLRRQPLTLLGALVHNPVVQEQLRLLGAAEANLQDPPVASTPTVVITAHGASDRDRIRWLNSGHQVIDTTCPLVRRAHDQLRQLVAQGFFPVVIGQPGHVEVRGLTGDFPEAIVLQSENDFLSLPDRPAFGVIAQTTQPSDRVNALVQALRQARPQARIEFRDTICQPTKDRQNALQELLKVVDVMIVVGGRDSHNTRRLTETARLSVPLTYQVERAEELHGVWFIGARHVGVTAGTSTLEETVQSVLRRLEQFAFAQEQGSLAGVMT